MATRPTWQGYLRLSLVSCPVALYTATSRSGEVHFNMLSKKTHNRVRMIPTDPEEGHSETWAYIPGSSFSSGFGRSISIRIVRVVGSSAAETRVTLPSTVCPSGPNNRTSATQPGRIAAAFVRQIAIGGNVLSYVMYGGGIQPQTGAKNARPARAR